MIQVEHLLSQESENHEETAVKLVEGDDVGIVQKADVKQGEVTWGPHSNLVFHFPPDWMQQEYQKGWAAVAKEWTAL